ncbi:MAG TPA: hypothetical protein VK399_17005 [Longimicrobiaceae bacterium]|jgi:hypothetical protein|nr:hypothetical protein [Longimicrobiaceae bacterium]
MASTNISEIVEISNTTSDTYFMYVWDDEHEGRYTPFDKDDWNYPRDGAWLTIGPRAHLRADDCGIPDGGKSAGKDRTRVIFKAEPNQRPSQGDPGRGLRVNRVGVGDGYDKLVFRDHSNGKLLKEIQIPTKMHQSLLLLIDEQEGAMFEQTDIAESGEHQLQEAGKVVGEVFKTMADIFLEVMKHIP